MAVDTAQEEEFIRDQMALFDPNATLHERRCAHALLVLNQRLLAEYDSARDQNRLKEVRDRVLRMNSRLLTVIDAELKR